MLPDNWLDALKLPTRIVGGLFAASALLLILDRIGALDLGSLGSPARSIVFVVLVLAGCLAAAEAIAAVYGVYVGEPRKTSELARRRAVRAAEQTAAVAAAHEATLLRLDTLSKEEVAVVAKAIGGDSPSFLDYVHSPPLSLLMAKALVYTPGGQHHGDYYPFSFHDYVWASISARRDEFLGKHEEFKRREEEEKRQQRRGGR